MAVVAVLAERHLAQEEIAQLVDAVGVGQRERVDHVADRLRHLLAAVEQEAVGEDAPRHRDAGRHQEGRPVDRVEAHDVLADDVQVGRPVAPEFRAVGVGKADAGDVVGQRVDPDIHDVLGIAGHPDAPVEGGARDRQVLQPALHEARDLVQPLLRQHEVRDALRRGRAACPDRPRAGRNSSPPRPIRPACPAGRGATPVARRRRSRPRRNRPRRAPSTSRHSCRDRCRRSSPSARQIASRRAVVALLGGADEVVVRAVQALDHGLEARHVAVDQLARGRGPRCAAVCCIFWPCSSVPVRKKTS